MARVLGCVLWGVEGRPVDVEVDVSAGVPVFDVVGLGAPAARGLRQRVRAALRNSGFPFPLRRVTVSLSAMGGGEEPEALDLPVALGVLAASGRLPAKSLEPRMAVGGLSLGGEARPVRGALALALAAGRLGRRLVLPAACAPEAGLAEGLELEPVGSLAQAVRLLGGAPPEGGWPGEPCPGQPPAEASGAPPWADAAWGGGTPGREEDLSEVRGLSAARRAVEVAAAGGHHLLLVGPPGVGKTMLCRRLVGLLPPLSPPEALEVACIWGAMGGLTAGHALPRRRPFRAPHHSCSVRALVGGWSGDRPRPGELTLAHRGVLFLDELSGFEPAALAALRRPLEEGRILLAGAAGGASLPARVLLVAAMNPCPCGHRGDPLHPCACTPGQVRRHLGRVGGPLLDRLDLQLEVARPSLAEAEGGPPPEPSAAVRDRVARARGVQARRSEAAGLGGLLNGELSGSLVERFCRPDRTGAALLAAAFERLGLSLRARDGVLRVARTIADLEGWEGELRPSDLAEALQYRCLDRGLAGAGEG
ncbi:MAG: YifB family Mg chelatase-like AAA ATPase [Acetobacteraceae bacterium]|nr:YifB family Mg chelatase-like AAA ATPase [Acetobacteraceae bacterium]